MKQKYLKRPSVDVTATEYLMQKGFCRGVAEALSARGVNERNFDDYFGDTVPLHSPFEMVNMAEAVETISYVAESGGSILIYGDYDADGLTASSILSLYFSDNGIDNDVIIPTRDEGYGLHAENVMRAFERKYYDLVLTVDCGISNAEEVCKIVEELGVEVVVTDHHELPEVLPDCICVNPKLGYPFPYLAGAGVAWKLVEAMSNRETAARYACLAAIGTIGDVMPMQDENRSIVKLGLANFNHKSLLKLAELANCSEKLTSNEIAMRLAPRINAAGRLGSPQAALEVLLCRDTVDNNKINRLVQLNEQRRTALDEIMAQAEQLCDVATICRERMVFIYSDSWQHGLLGLIANRFKEKYNVPAMVMTLYGDNYVGSARGIETMDLFDVFTKCKDCFVKYGGHKASVGFSVAKNRLNELREALATALSELDGSCFEKYMYYDVELGKDCNVSEIMALSEKLQPMLTQDKIICRVTDSVQSAVTFGRDSAHLSATLTCGLEIKGFKYGAYAPIIRNGANVDLLCSVELDSFSGKICGMIEDLTLTNSVCFDDFYKYNLLKNFTPNDAQFIDEKDADIYLKSNSVAAIFDDYETYLAYCDRYNFDEFAVDIFFDNSVSRKTVVVSPVEGYSYDKYDAVVCFARKGIRRNLPSKTIFVEVACAREDLYQLALDRDICLAVFAALKRKDDFDSVKGVFDKYLTAKLTYPQFIVAIRVFEELGLIKVVDSYNVEFILSSKTDLNNSRIYATFQSK
ncbi:MAG: DHH family phosphoesterase [Clostridiales bacterium]|nr:DHH family phosphoesterase [Clostridiales bacterium]